MKIIVHIEPTLKHHAKYLKPLAKAMAKKGHDVAVRMNFVPGGCDLAVFWGHGKRTENLRARQIAAGKDYLVAEAAVFGEQLDMISLGFNGCRGEAEYEIGPDPDGRLKMLGVEAALWIGGDKKLFKKRVVFVVGQMESDSTVAGVNQQRFLHDAIVAGGNKTIFRQHPKGGVVPRIKCKMHDGDFDDMIKRASCVVTISSTSAVGAVLAGVPVIALDPRSMAYDVAGHSLDDIKNPPMPDRDEWMKKLAYVQWAPDELADGSALDVIFQRYAK